VFSTPYLVSILCWAALEVVLVLRDALRRKARFRSDRGTRFVVGLCVAVPIVVGSALHRWLPALDTPVSAVFAVVGLVVLWTGLVVRVWAVLTLGRSFSTFVQAETDQAVVSHGPYRWVRHPSYTGLLLIALGFGLGARNWLALLICAVVPMLGMLPRMAVEESELVRVLGDRYRDYRRTTRRLIPGLW
jgi:protein-S-isoprenylcysteine O-methyltransferase Ste14